MVKAAIVVLAGTDGHENLGRVVNALETAREFAEADDELMLIFDGAGTTWVPALDDPTHDYHDLYQSVREHAAVCDYCSSAFDVADAVDAAGLDTLDEHDGHPSIRRLVDEGYEVVTF
jgi:hypothetical protein